MKNFIISMDNEIFRLSAECVNLDFENEVVEFIINHHTVAQFKRWDYWYEETGKEEKKSCCSCK